MPISTPTVSVLLPVYNAEKYLALSIDSILSQSWQDFQLIVVDDGSIDASNEIIRKYCAEDSRVVLIEQENQGISSALNNALIIAEGKYCALMNADDISLPDRLSLQFSFLDENPEILVVGGQGYIIDCDGDPVRPLSVVLSHNEIDRSNLLTCNQNGIINPSVMFRTASARKIGGYSEKFFVAEDLDFFLRIAEIGYLANLDRLLLYYRQHGKSISDKTQSSIMSECANKAVIDARIRRGLPPLAERTAIATTGTSPSEYDYEINTACQAEEYGNRTTALKHFKKAFFMCPLCLRTWTVLLKITMPNGILKALKSLMLIGNSNKREPSFQVSDE